MTFEEFIENYQERRQFFENYTYQDLLKKVYIKLRKGSEIRFQDVSSFQENSSTILNEILVDVPQIKLVKDRIYQSLETVNVTKETDVKIVYGDYGHGKSQTGHILVEEIQMTRENLRFVHLENISSFRNFMINIGNHIKDEYGSDLDSINQYIEVFNQAHNTSEISNSMLIQKFVAYIKQMTTMNYTHILILDELDKIVTDELERKNWIDFLVTLNDESGLALLLICLIPQRMAQKLVSMDRRLERWNHFFNINATILDGKYSTEVIKAIASILALNDYYYQIENSERTIKFVYNIIDYKLDYLESASIRSVNTWVLILGELISQYEKYNFWQAFDSFNTQPNSYRLAILSKKMVKLLKSDNLPQFELYRDDSEDVELYRTEFVTTSLNVERYETDGHFKLYKDYMNTEKLSHEIGLITEFTTSIEKFNFDRVEKIITEFPLIIINVGLEKSSAKELNNQFKTKLEKSIQKYPVKIITIPYNLIPPLLLLPEDEKEDNFNQILQLVINWANVITGHRDELQYFLKALPTEIIRRQILLRSLQLAKMTPEDIKEEKKVKIEDIDSVDKTKGSVFMAANIVSTIEEIQTFKYINTIRKNVSETLMVQFPSDALEIQQEFDTIFQILEKNKLIVTGGSKRKTVKQSETWDQLQAMELLKTKFQ